MRNKRVKPYIRHAAAILLAGVILLTSGFTAYAEPFLGYISAAPLTKNGKVFDLREAAGQSLYGYDTLQGACANDGYVYYTLYDRNKEKCRIVKAELSSLDVVKVSAPLPIYHGNNLTYNTKKNLILATCCEVKTKRAVFIDPATLTVVSRKDIKLKRSKKIPKSVVRGYKGFTAIAYNEKHDCYVGRLRKNNNVIIFDGNLNPVRYVKLKGKKTYLLSQGMESEGDYIYDVRSFKGKHKYNMATIHKLNGSYVGKIQLPYAQNPGIEVECIFHDGDSFYAGFYHTTSQKHDYKKYHVIRNNYIYKLNTD
ncbi:MAG: hypothetical protein IKG25_04435 [Mogibacterium sp.]|nr:hypothetical protein [Mogibacterium sp.]MBR4090158.1 hypothetical protein [Mogibacterium sp.]